MKTYLYNEPLFDADGNICGNIVRQMTEKEILDYYWPWWKPKMIKKYGLCHKDITEQNCIDDWVVANWGWLKEDEH